MSEDMVPTRDVSGTVFEHGSEEVAQTYAQAFVNLLPEEDDGEEAVTELEAFVSEVWKPNPEFSGLLANEFVRPERRDEMLVRVLEGKSSRLLLNFLRVLNQRGRLRLLPLVSHLVRQLQNRRTNRVEVTVRTAVPLADSEAEGLIARLKELMPNTTPILKPEVNPELLGGLVLQIGDRLYDASVRSNLEIFRQKLLDRRFREIRERREQLYQHS